MNSHSDPRWQKRRLEIMQRDGFKCIACGSASTTLNVHHKFYYGELWEVDDTDLQTLCEICHEALGPHPKGGVWYAKDKSGQTIVTTEETVLNDCYVCSQCQGEITGDEIGAYEHDRCTNLGKVVCSDCCDGMTVLLEEERSPF